LQWLFLTRGASPSLKTADSSLKSIRHPERKSKERLYGKNQSPSKQ
jgi:hypothetical protein